MDSFQSTDKETASRLQTVSPVSEETEATWAKAVLREYPVS